MIPKILHYCWFGRGKPPKLFKKCMKSWKKFCPDYQIMLWNEDSFDVTQFQYVSEAYSKRKFAFVADFVRLYALVTVGGVYVDSDVEIVGSIDPFLNEKAFSGFESKTGVPTGIMGSEKGFPLFSELLHYYDGKHFLDKNGNCDTTTNVTIITNELTKRGLKLDNTKQVIDGFALFPKDVFCPLNPFGSGTNDFSEQTVCIHHFASSWVPKPERRRAKIKYFLAKVFGEKFVLKLVNFRNKLKKRKSVNKL